MHTNNIDCQGCESKLATVAPALANWVRSLRASHPDAHVSCGHRGQEDQEADYKKGVSKAHWGQSAHNASPSLAVDLFRLTQSGGASFDAPWYREVVAPAARTSGLVWGGDWQSIKDMPHVEYPGFKPFKA